MFLGPEPQERIKTRALISTQCHQKLRQPKNSWEDWRTYPYYQEEREEGGLNMEEAWAAWLPLSLQAGSKLRKTSENTLTNS